MPRSHNAYTFTVALLFNTGFVEETLSADLKRFRARLLKEAREEKMESFKKKTTKT